MSDKTTTTTTTTTSNDITITPVIHPTTRQQINVAVVGCVHGELDEMYKAITAMERFKKVQIHIVLCCGDFQSIRNTGDLTCLACPPKYSQMVDFWKYYNGIAKAPYLTIFTHGNHEASNYLTELPYGGWVADNIFYTGFASVLTFFGIGIASVGGITKDWDYKKARFETNPMDEDSIRSLYHTREYDAWAMMQYNRPLDFVMSHDWPRNACNMGNVQQLLKLKPAFAQEVAKGGLGSTVQAMLLDKLRPYYWFSAHLHCKYVGLYDHIEMDKKAGKQTPPNTSDKTRFIALDKVKERKRFLQLVQYEAQDEPSLKSSRATIKLEVDDDNNNNSDNQDINKNEDMGSDNDEAVTTTTTTTTTTSINQNNTNQKLTIDEMIKHFCYCPDWIQILQFSQVYHPRLRNSTLGTQQAKNIIPYTPTNHTQYYAQYDGKMCECVTQSTTQDELFEIGLFNTTDVTHTGTRQHYQIPTNFIPTAPVHNGKMPQGFRPDTSDKPSFALNPQTIEFCNKHRILVPIFSEDRHWCSPKHALTLFKQQTPY